MRTTAQLYWYVTKLIWKNNEKYNQKLESRRLKIMKYNTLKQVLKQVRMSTKYINIWLIKCMPKDYDQVTDRITQSNYLVIAAKRRKNVDAEEKIKKIKRINICIFINLFIFHI